MAIDEDEVLKQQFWQQFKSFEQCYLVDKKSPKNLVVKKQSEGLQAQLHKLEQLCKQYDENSEQANELIQLLQENKAIKHIPFYVRLSNLYQAASETKQFSQAKESFRQKTALTFQYDSQSEEHACCTNRKRKREKDGNKNKRKKLQLK